MLPLSVAATQVANGVDTVLVFGPLLADSTLAFDPGTDWQYSNTGMFLLGVVIEKVTGGDYCGPSRRMEMAGPARKVKSTGMSRDAELARRLWDLSVEMTGVDPGI